MMLNIAMGVAMGLFLIVCINNDLPNDKCKRRENKNLCGTCYCISCEYKYFDE